MKLYYAPAVCSLASHITAQELGIPLQLVKVDLKTKKTETGEDYLAINKKGYVPCLQLDDGQTLTEGPAILQYLADLKPSANLAPAQNTFARYRLQEALNFITSELHKGLGNLFNPAFDQNARQVMLERIDLRLKALSSDLADKEFVLGNQFTVADAYLFTVLNWGQWVKVNMNDYPVLAAYLKRLAARPSVQAALKAEGF